MHLQKLSRGYRLRLRVPRNLQQLIGRTELRYTIPVNNKTQAEQVARQATKRLKGLFREIQTGIIMPKAIDVPKLVKQYIKEGLQNIREYHESAPSMESDQFDQHQDTLTFLKADMIEAYACRDRKVIKPVVNAFLRAKGITIDKFSGDSGFFASVSSRHQCNYWIKSRTSTKSSP